ncbi:unnamed protein product [Rotaria magnacalcarata]|uniref:Uncharacterized protein n=1 Tax=Rotaria magnacalcarata TaxID=392030 RepID=A0A820BRK1_9BILA|nr:unnamed protein product [Rotaria magnacalcarata]
MLLLLTNGGRGVRGTPPSVFTPIGGVTEIKDGVTELNGGKFAPPPPMGGVEIIEGTKPIKLFFVKFYRKPTITVL